MTKEDILGAARRVAMVLANEGEPGLDLVRAVRSMGEVRGAGYNDGWCTLLCYRVPADLGSAM